VKSLKDTHHLRHDDAGVDVHGSWLQPGPDFDPVIKQSQIVKTVLIPD
jgi:hypothetical protein